MGIDPSHWYQLVRISKNILDYMNQYIHLIGMVNSSGSLCRSIQLCLL